MMEFRRGPATEFGARIIAIAIATVLNIWPIPVAFGLDILLGIILPFFFLRTQQPVWALVAAVVTPLPTIYLWGHPYFIVILFAEISFIVALRQRSINPIHSMLLYWITLGGLLVFACYYVILDSSIGSTVAIYCKQAINCIYSLALVDFVFFIYTLTLARDKVSQNIVLSDSVQTAGLLIFVSLSILAIILWSHQQEREVLRNATDGAIHATILLQSDIDFHLEQLVDLARQSCTSAANATVEDVELCTMVSALALGTAFAPSERGHQYRSDGEMLRRAIGDEEKANSPAQPHQNVPLYYRALSAGERVYLFPVHHGRARLDYAVLSMSATALLRNLKRGQSAYIQVVPPRPESSYIMVGDNQRTAQPTDPGARVPQGLLLSGNKTLVSAWRETRLITTSTAAHSTYSVIVVTELARQIDDYFTTVTRMMVATLAAVMLGALITYFWAAIIRNELRRLVYFASSDRISLTGTSDSGRMLSRSPSEEVRNLASTFQSIIVELNQRNAALNRLRLHQENIISRGPGVLFTLEIDIDGSGVSRIGSCTYMSKSIKEHFGYNVEEAIAIHRWKSYVHPADWARVVCTMRNLLDTGREAIQYRLRMPDGGYQKVHCELSVAADASLRQTEVIGFLSDYEAVHQADAQHSKSERLASLSQMASGMAHELAQPLNNIGITAQNVRIHLRDAGANSEYLVDKINRIIQQVDRAGKIIRNLRIFGRDTNIPLVPLSGQKIIREVVALTAESLENHRITLVESTPPKDITLIGDETMIAQILVNLINNSRDAYDSLPIATATAIIRIHLRVSNTTKKAMIIVDDDAGGIDNTIMPIIFEPFTSNKPAGQGMGLGLALSKSLAHDMGGNIVAENTQTGARFTLTLSTIGSNQPQ